MSVRKSTIDLPVHKENCESFLFIDSLHVPHIVTIYRAATGKITELNCLSLGVDYEYLADKSYSLHFFKGQSLCLIL